MKRILVPAVAVLLVVASFVALSGWNRSGAPHQQITLTERELGIVYFDDSTGDAPGLHLRIDVEERSEALDSRNWLTEDRLRRIGFALAVPAGAPDARERYRRTLPRIAWVVFEYEGEAWREIERRHSLRASQQDLRTSRLVPIDAGLDREALLARYPSGHLILRATIGLNYRDPADGGPLVFGAIQRLHPPELTVPRALRDRLTSLEARPPYEGLRSAPRYEVDVAVGRLGIPYITDVRRR